MAKLRKRTGDFDYDVCFSFAGENRAYVHRTADILQAQGVRVFYDEYEEAELWGKDLYEHLHEIYSRAARYCVVFISKDYAKKLWTNHERRSAQERAFRERKEYILPARFDGTRIPGLADTVSYVTLKTRTPKALARLISQKIGDRQTKEYFPPVPDRLLAVFKPRSNKKRDLLISAARGFFNSLRRMNQEERTLVYHIFTNGCPGELPENVHINLDLLRRASGMSPARSRKIVGQIRSLGFESYVREDSETEGRLGKHEMLVVEYNVLSGDYFEPGALLASRVIGFATDAYCEQHALEAFQRLDFHQLSTSTFERDTHSKRRLRRKTKRK